MASSPQLIDLDTPCEFFELELEREPEREKLEWEESFFSLYPDEFYQQYKQLCETTHYKEASRIIVKAIYELERAE